MSLTSFIKYNKAIYNIYYNVMNVAVNCLKIFIKPDDKLILINSFAGRKYDDSPRAIFELMRNDPRFRKCKIVWAFHEPGKYNVENKIRTNGFLYFRTALSARVWVTNSSVERGLRFKGKRTFFFNTWHGTPIKRMGSDIDNDNTSFRGKHVSSIDAMMSQSHFETEVFSRSFGIPKENFLEVGLPRNDVLTNHTEDYRSEIRRRLKIDANKKVILYAPTFREYEKNNRYEVIATPPLDLKKWEEELPGFVFLFRAHYEVAKVMNLQENGFVRDMTDYPILNDLLIAADILISDYSSVFFDYAITGKPMLQFTYDYEEYANRRGMYFDIRDYLSGGRTEDEIISVIKNIDIAGETAKTIAFRERFVNFYGQATKEAVDFIATELKL